MEDKEPEKPKSGFGFEKSLNDINRRIAWDEWSMRNAKHPSIASGHKQCADAYRDLLFNKIAALKNAHLRFMDLFDELMRN
jgi:hypothetical protein